MQALHGLQSQLDTEHAKLVQKVEQMKRTVQEGTTIASLQDQISKLVADKEELENKHKYVVNVNEYHILLQQRKEIMLLNMNAYFIYGSFYLSFCFCIFKA
jgi:hypothetical protein